MSKVKRHPSSKTKPQARLVRSRAPSAVSAPLEAPTAKRRSQETGQQVKAAAKSKPMAAAKKTKPRDAVRSTTKSTKSAAAVPAKSKQRGAAPASKTAPVFEAKGRAPAPPAKPVHKSAPTPQADVGTTRKTLLRPSATTKSASEHLPDRRQAPASAQQQAKLGPKVGNSSTMGRRPLAGGMPTTLPPGYRPSEAEPFMGALQRIYFRNKLLQWKEDIIVQNRETLQVLHDDTLQHSDLADRANSEAERALELRARDRQRKLVSKIDGAISRIDDGSYGYCEETGEPISLKRLDARPIATMSLEAQERHERREKVHRED